MQQLLDRTYEAAPATARTRFERKTTNVNSADDTTGSAPQAQALRVAIAIVVRDQDVLLVCRRDDTMSGITWQFPAGVIKPGVKPETATVRETLDETGVHCAIREALGARLHPTTGVRCLYFLCEYLAGDATNSDSVENIDVAWVSKTAVTRFIPAESIYPPILDALKENE
ncbi:hypothetical protein SLNWT_7131 [Streptomyces albus]|uniref:Nudix hydrolase domain-containing protein n=2 Tax=Streptomyces TaxID=1883 RepID=A0A0B5FAL3_STRA4|nr:hypothetical protein SLNWT_7131 [Streptomyces albus]AOU81811.1 hypothetical protein SLNHY_7120 [Streptomyces albus]AYN37499.1 8-oxo-dGTP diphosphatase [Streptomyces albus]